MKIPNQVEKFYIECMSCPVSKSECPKAWKDFSKGLVPRAFDICRSRFPKLLVVAKNPGHPLEKSSERQFYAGKKGKRLFQSHLDWRKEFVEKILGQPDPSLRFHKNRYRYLRYFLGHVEKLESYKEYKRRGAQVGRLSKDNKKIMQSVAITNLFKCSTKNEREKLSFKDVKTCLERNFLKEVEMLKPQVILALGNEVGGILKRLEKDQDLPPVVKIKHPSYFYEKTIEARELSKAKRALSKYL
jgi:uracil-DNA glycosylase